MRLWIPFFLLIVSIAACSSRPGNAQRATPVETPRREFTDSIAGAYAAAAQTVIVNRLLERLPGLNLWANERDTVYVGYPDTLDPPDWFLQCSLHRHIALLPYSRHRSVAADTGFKKTYRIYLTGTLSKDSVSFGFHENVPRKEYKMLGDIHGIAQLAYADSRWNIYKWKWNLRM